MPNGKSNRTKKPNWFTKSEYARKIRKSPTHVNDLIDRGELEVIEINGGEIVVAPPEAQPTAAQGAEKQVVSENY